MPMEWTVVTALVVLVGLLGAIIKPIISLNTTITKLTAAVDRLRDDLDALGSKNSRAVGNLWAHNEEQDSRLDEHDKRITVLEKK